VAGSTRSAKHAPSKERRTSVKKSRKEEEEDEEDEEEERDARAVRSQQDECDDMKAGRGRVGSASTRKQNGRVQEKESQAKTMGFVGDRRRRMTTMSRTRTRARKCAAK
jgi:hypothetical protein